LYSRCRWSRVDIAKIHVLESEIHSDVVIVWNIDADGGSRAGKSDDIKIGEVGLRESAFLKLFAPRKFGNQVFGLRDKLVESSRDDLVYDSNKAFKFSPRT
jgi:hypothetical protein